MTLPKKRSRARRDALSDAYTAMRKSAEAYIASRRLYRKWFKEADRCYRLLAARKDPAQGKDLAELKEMLDLIRPNKAGMKARQRAVETVRKTRRTASAKSARSWKDLGWRKQAESRSR